jgi:hypothetical protein
MFQRIIEGLGGATGAALRLTSLAVAVAVALFVTICFLCAAAFVLVLETYGLVQACLAGAAAFFAVTLIAAGCFLAYKKKMEREAAKAAKAASQSLLTDPMLLAAGLNLIRAVGVRRLIPILAVGGIALGFMASRTAGSDDATGPAE